MPLFESSIAARLAFADGRIVVDIAVRAPHDTDAMYCLRIMHRRRSSDPTFYTWTALREPVSSAFAPVPQMVNSQLVGVVHGGQYQVTLDLPYHGVKAHELLGDIELKVELKPITLLDVIAAVKSDS